MAIIEAPPETPTPSRTKQSLAALVLLAAPSVTIAVTVYGLFFTGQVDASGAYSLATVIATPVTILASLGMRTLLLARNPLALAPAHLLRLLLIPASMAVSAAIALLAAPEHVALVAIVAAVRGLDAIHEMVLARLTVRDDFAGVVTTGAQRLAITLLVTVGLIAVGADATLVAAAQVVVALGWYAAVDLQHLPRPQLIGPADLVGLFRRLLPLGVGGLAAVGAFSLPRIVAAPRLTPDELGFLAAATTAPLIISGALGALVEIIGGRSIPHTGRRAWAAKRSTITVAAIVPIVLLPAGIAAALGALDADARTLALIGASGILAVATTFPNLVLHRADHFRAIWMGRTAGVGVGLAIASTAPETIALESVGAALAASQVVTLMWFFTATGSKARQHAPLGVLSRAAKGTIIALTILILPSATVLAVRTWIPRLDHWSTLVALACLVVALVNLRRAWSVRHGLFDPFVWLEAYAVYFFAVAPILHVVLDYAIAFPLAPPDMRTWYGFASVLNLAALVIHGLLMRRVARRRITTTTEPPRITYPTGPAIDAARRLTALSALAFVATIVLVGGPAAYLNQSLQRLGGFQGLGPLVLLSDLLPICVVISIALMRWREGRAAGALKLLVGAMVLQLMLSGLRGSRIQIVFSGIVCLGILYGAGLRFRRATFAALAIGAMVFSYGYTAYKDSGLAALSGSTESPIERSVGVLLLGDFGRSDIQALLLWHDETSAHAPLAGGRTYVDDVLVHVPGAARPALEGWSKRDYGTQWMIGSLPDGFRIGNIYGVSGEAVLNFGTWAFLPALALRSVLTRWVLLWYDNQRRRGRPAFLIAPFLCIGLITLLMSDLDQVVYMTIRFGFVPLLIYSYLVREARKPRRFRVVSDRFLT